MWSRIGALAAAWLAFSLVGCFTWLDPTARMRSAEESERDKDLAVPTIADVTEVSNVMPVQVSGVGLVTGLAGTGGAPQGQFRSILEQQLRKQNVENAKAILDSPDNALVLVTGLIPPGAHRKQPIDIEVTLPAGSKATSLKGGFLQVTYLRNHEAASNLSPERLAQSDKLLQGHVLGLAKGPLLVGFGNPDEPAEQRRARIWGGGLSLIDRPFYLMLKKDNKSPRVANVIADRINLLFQDDIRKHQAVLQQQRLLMSDEIAQQINHKFDRQASENAEMAKPSNEMVAVRVPYSYRLNPERYLRVSRLIPLREVGDQAARYRRRLHKMLPDPGETIRAALRLEALGKESIPALKQGLDNAHPLVRFASAEALAYLGSTAGVPELVLMAQKHSPLRAYSLLALSGLDEGACRGRLEEMLAADDAELRCGAFCALRLIHEPALNILQNSSDSADLPLGGKLTGGSFWVHRVAPRSTPLVTFAVSKRAEIVIFGQDAQFVAPVKILAGSDYTITADRGDDRITVSRITRDGMQRRQCGFQLQEVLECLAELGGQYPDAIDLLRKADDRACLTCQVRAHVLPPEVDVQTLADAGRDPAFFEEQAAKREE